MPRFTVWKEMPMALQAHLISHLKEMYATERDYCAYLCGWTDNITNPQLKTVLLSEVQDITQQMNNLQQCLAVFGDFPQTIDSPLISAFKQEDQFCAQQVPQGKAADMDVHLAITDITVGGAEIGLYQSMIAMARALNQPEVVTLLQDNLKQEKDGLLTMQHLLPDLVSLSSQQQAA